MVIAGVVILAVFVILGGAYTAVSVVTATVYGCSLRAAMGFREEVFVDGGGTSIYHIKKGFRPTGTPYHVTPSMSNESPLTFEQALDRLTVKDYTRYKSKGIFRSRLIDIQAQKNAKNEELDRIMAEIESMTSNQLRAAMDRATSEYEDNPEFNTLLYNTAEEELIKRGLSYD